VVLERSIFNLTFCASLEVEVPIRRRGRQFADLQIVVKNPLTPLQVNILLKQIASQPTPAKQQFGTLPFPFSQKHSLHLLLRGGQEEFIKKY
jgi:hypothetical protein